MRCPNVPGQAKGCSPIQKSLVAGLTIAAFFMTLVIAWRMFMAFINIALSPGMMDVGWPAAVITGIASYVGFSAKGRRESSRFFSE